MMLMTSGVLGLTGFWLWRRTARKQASRQPTRPTRITDPKLQGRGLSRVWQLQSHGCHCQHARNLGGRRLDIEDTLPLNAGLNGYQSCHCHYRPLRDERRGVRRDGQDRRAGLRFDLRAPERRLSRERRRREREWQCELAPR